MTVVVTHSTPADGTFSTSGATAWNANHTLTGVGTMATQDANAVAITGGTINGTTIGATTASTGLFTYISTSSSTSVTPTLSFNGSNSPYAAGATIAGSYLQHLLQNKSGTAGASTNYVLSNDIGTDSTYYGEFGMNSSVYSSGTPADFFSINNGIYFSGHDGDLSIGSGNGFKTYFAWGTAGQSAHVINASGAIGLNTSITGSTNFGSSGQVLTSAGSSATPTWTTPTAGTVTSVSFTGGIISVGTATSTPAFTVAGTSGGIPYFSSGTTWATSAALAANALVIGGGAGVAPATTTTGTGVVTALGVNTGTAGAFLVNGGVLGTPSSGVVTNLTGTASININGTVGATTPAAGTFTQVTVNGSNLNTAISPTGTGTVTISPAGALTINPTAASTINNASIGATTASTGAFTTLSASSTVSGTGFSTYLASPPAIGGTAAAAGSFTSLTATSVGTGGVLAKTGGKTAVTSIAATTTLTTGGTTLASQVMASGSTWRVVAYGTFVGATSATTRTFTMACFWGTTQLTAITTGSVLTTAQTTPWKVEFEITGSSATAAWVTGFLSAEVTSATIPLNYIATAASTTGLTTTSTLDFRVANGTAAVDAFTVHQVTIERIV